MMLKKIFGSLYKDIFDLKFPPSRACSQLPKGIKYHGFTYYPRKENFKDPPYEPSKLFLVRRIKSMRGRNPTERKILAQLNIDGLEKYSAHLNIVKNIPTINALLWKVKHLIDIKPITWKGKLPDDFLGTHLRETGELVISQKLRASPDQIRISKEMSENDEKPDRKYLREHLRRKWWKGLSGAAI